MKRELLWHEEAIQLERLERSRGEHDCEDAELKHEQCRDVLRSELRCSGRRRCHFPLVADNAKFCVGPRDGYGRALQLVIYR